MADRDPWWGPPAADPHEAVRRMKLWRHDVREHDWVGNTFGPVAVLTARRSKNPGGDVRRAATTARTGLIDPWRERRGASSLLDEFEASLPRVTED